MNCIYCKGLVESGLPYASSARGICSPCMIEILKVQEAHQQTRDYFVMKHKRNMRELDEQQQAAKQAAIDQLTKT